MSQVLTGQYLINYYNRYGAKLRGTDDTADNLMSAREIAAKHIELIAHQEHRIADLNTPVSYTIDRRIVNSLDKKD